MLECVVFDMDGVLVDSEPHWRALGPEFLASFIPDWNQELQSSIHGRSVYDVYKYLVAQHNLALSREEYIRRYENLSLEIYASRSTLVPGALELLSEIRSREIPTALASSSPRSWMNIVLERFGLSDYFSALVSSDDVACAVKPAPDIYLKVIEELDCNPRVSVAIEDSVRGVASAQSAGFSVLALCSDDRKRQAVVDASRVVDSLLGVSLKDLYEIIQRA